MKRIGIIAMAMALVLGLTQCKKEQNVQTNENETVAITLEIRNGGTRMDVNTVTGEVTYEEGDVIYVVSSGKYVGTLTHNGTNFAGSISNLAIGEPLYFYFLGNNMPTFNTDNTGCTVDISDQTDHLPVIECAPSNEIYTSGVTTFTAFLLNKCALVKFNVFTASEAASCITGFNNKLTISFFENTISYSQEGNGVIILPAGGGEKWAILLPQEALVESGSAYSRNGDYTGTRGAVPTIVENGYLTSGIDVVLITSSDHEFVDLSLPSGLLWATCNVGAALPEGYGCYFAWAETQPKSVYNWSTYQYCNGSNNTLTKYCTNSNYGYNGFIDNLTTLEPSDDAAMANWGSDWRMPTYDEWQELFGNTTNTWTVQNGVNGWLFSASNGNSIFLPAAGHIYSSLNEVGWGGYYWSSSLYTDNPSPSNAWEFFFYYNGNHGSTPSSRYSGATIRPVRSAE